MSSKQRSRRPVWAVYALALGVTVILGISGGDDWDPGRLAVIATFSVMSDLSAVETGSARLKISGSFLGVVLAAVLLGGGPGAVVGALTILIGWLRWREAPHYLLNNLVTFIAFPMLAGRGLHEVVALTGTSVNSAAYCGLVFAAFIAALALNFVGVAGYQCWRDRGSLAQKVSEALLPILASELFSALLTVIAVYAARALGTVGIAAIGVVLVIFQYLVGELLVSQRRSEELKRLASTDDLTGLPNREAFRERLTREIEDCQREELGFGVILMDLDHFKEINDTLGHHHGDLVLRDLGPRLAARIGGSGIVARLGGDEFAILPGSRTTDRDELDALATQLLDCVRAPIRVDGIALELGASLGIARFPRDGTDESTLIRRADVAMYTAKSTQRGSCLYSVEQDQGSLRRLAVTSDLRRALGAGEIIVHFQPIVELPGQRVSSAEGLVRWEHPVHGLLAPPAFIPAIERTGLIGPLTRHVLSTAVEQCARWRAEGEALSVAVNLSVRDLLDQRLPRDVELALDRSGLPAEALHLEITESMLMSDPARALETVSRISEMGVGFAVDDFGTGYSSLAYLRRLPINELKIDRSFVSHMLTNPSDLIIVRSTINLAHDLGLRVVAEGVEDEATAECLDGLGCDLAQGYHFGRPVPAPRFAQMVRPEPVKLV